MYIDKIYTKLYSERDWNGLNQLVNEIKSFARKDYSGLGVNDRVRLRAMRNHSANLLKGARSLSNEDDYKDIKNVINDDLYKLDKDKINPTMKKVSDYYKTYGDNSEIWSDQGDQLGVSDLELKTAMIQEFNDALKRQSGMRNK